MGLIDLIGSNFAHEVLVDIYQKNKQKESITASDIAHNKRYTLSHTFKYIHEYEKEKLLTREDEGRKKLLKLTPKGLKVAELIIQIRKCLSQNS